MKQDSKYGELEYRMLKGLLQSIPFILLFSPHFVLLFNARRRLAQQRTMLTIFFVRGSNLNRDTSLSHPFRFLDSIFLNVPFAVISIVA